MKEGRKLAIIATFIASIVITGIGVITKNIFTFILGFLFTISLFIYSLKEMYKKAITVAILLIFSVAFIPSFTNATIISWSFDTDTPGQNPSGWTIYEDADTNIQVYDDAGNNRCFLYDNNVSSTGGCSMYRSFSSSPITEDLNFTFDVKIDRTASCYFSATLMGPDEEINIEFLNGSIYVYSYYEDPKLLGTYTANAWITITTQVFSLNSTYMVTDYTNTIWGTLNTVGFNVTLFSTEYTSNMTVNASIDNIILKWGEYSTNINVSTEIATLIDWNAATLNGYLSNPDGESVTCGFQIGTQPGTYDQTITVTTLSASGKFSYRITSLDDLTTYYYRAFANSGNVTIYGEEQSFTTCSRYGYHLDQICDSPSLVTSFPICSTMEGKQSFVPTTKVLSKIAIEISKGDAPDAPLELYILDSNDNVLRSTEINAGDIPALPGWIEWDFKDLIVTPGETYYIKLKSNTNYEAGYYSWQASTEDVYVNGRLYYDGYVTGYDPRNIEDCAFKTYGSSWLTASFTYQSENLSLIVDASNSSSDPGNIVHYQWDWNGDGTYDDEGLIASHTYATNGTYNITLRIINEYGDWLTATAAITLMEGQSGNGTIQNTSNATEGDNGTGDDDDNGGGWTIKWKLPLSWFAIFLAGFIGITGAALTGFFMKPESIKALGYAPAGGTALITILSVMAVILYHAYVPWYYWAICIILAIFVLYVTIKVILSSPKRRRVAKSLFNGGRRKRR